MTLDYSTGPEVRPEETICGYVAHRTGEPCKQEPGWGTPNSTGPCCYHTAEAEAERDKLKARFLKIYQIEPVTIDRAASLVGLNSHTIFRWRHFDTEFDAKCEEAKQASLRARIAIVEDSLFQRIIDGDASATEVIFWLTNVSRQVGSRDWLHVQQILHGVDGSISDIAESWTRAVKAVAEMGSLPEGEYEDRPLELPEADYTLGDDEEALDDQGHEGSTHPSS